MRTAYDKGVTTAEKPQTPFLWRLPSGQCVYLRTRDFLDVVVHVDEKHPNIAKTSIGEMSRPYLSTNEAWTLRLGPDDFITLQNS